MNANQAVNAQIFKSVICSNVLNEFSLFYTQLNQ